jgi:glycogen phosphorylase
VTADFDAYASAQREAERLFRDEAGWRRRAVLNTARTGWFSSDRTIRDYARDIWRVPVEA